MELYTYGSGAHRSPRQSPPEPIHQLTVIGNFASSLIDELHEEFAQLRCLHVAVPHREIYAGLDGHVKGSDTVGREDQNSVVVLKDAKED
jgi:hypothetical protein